MDNVVLVGGGGHALVCAEVLGENVAVHIKGYVATSPSDGMHLQYLGTDTVFESLREEGVTHAFVAVGDNRTRRRLGDELKALGFQLVTAISHAAVVSPTAHVGNGALVMPGAVVNAAAVIGEGAIINTGATVDHDCSVGLYCHVAPGVNLGGWVKMETGSMMGIGSTAIPRSIIGEWAMVGAGATVIQTVPPGSVAVGTPARALARS